MINRAFGDQPPSVLTLAAERQGLLREVGKENRVPASPTRVQDAADALGRAVGGVESSRAFRYASEVRPKLLELEDAEVDSGHARRQHSRDVFARDLAPLTVANLTFNPN